jgi:hypothetical protein
MGRKRTGRSMQLQKDGDRIKIYFIHAQNNLTGNIKTIRKIIMFPIKYSVKMKFKMKAQTTSIMYNNWITSDCEIIPAVPMG